MSQGLRFKNCLGGRPECVWSGMAGASDAGERGSGKEDAQRHCVSWFVVDMTQLYII